MRPPLDIRRELPRALPTEDLLGLRIPEAPEHGSRVSRSIVTSSVINGPAQQAVAPARAPRASPFVVPSGIELGGFTRAARGARQVNRDPLGSGRRCCT